MSLNKNFFCIDYLFRGKENRIITFIESSNILNIEIEEKSTNQEWNGSFNIEYIEELTKKTGNYKSFEVFVSMLQTVLTENVPSLSLDLMTYGDLEELRKLKMGSISKCSNIINPETIRQNKRYLILTYTTDFDKVHYPLPLLFQGTTDVCKLKDTIIALRQQVYNSAKGTSEYEKFELSELNKKMLSLQVENDRLVSTLEKYKAQFHNGESIDDLKKEIKAVKSIVRSLEEELSEEKLKHQRVLLRKNREIKSLTDELEEIKATKRNLNFKVHSLTNELAIYKRPRSRNGITSPRPPVCPSPKSSLDLLASTSKILSKGLKNSRSSPIMLSDPETNRLRYSSCRGQSHSFDKRLPTSGRRCNSADRYNNKSISSSKFNPTAYIEQQKLKKVDIEEKRKREIRSRISTGNMSDRSRGSSPASYRGSYTSKPLFSKFSYLSSSNASSLSDLDTRVSRSRPKTKVTPLYKHRPKIVKDVKHHPTSLNDTNDQESENDSLMPDPRKFLEYTNGFKSDDNSVKSTERNNREKIGKKPIRSYVVDSGDDDVDKVARNKSKSAKSSYKGFTTKTSRTQQSNNNHLSYREQSSDINDIDQRLDALQDFFKKYLKE